jgi:hypothetical protein
MKALMQPEEVVVVYIHDPLFCLDGDKMDGFCSRQYLEPNVSMLFHYRSSVFAADVFNSTSTIQDTTMWKYKDDLIRGVSRTLNETGFKP